jgi:hypothetical protein
VRSRSAAPGEEDERERELGDDEDRAHAGGRRRRQVQRARCPSGLAEHLAAGGLERGHEDEQERR